jgi:hypothetical protein
LLLSLFLLSSITTGAAAGEKSDPADKLVPVFDTSFRKALYKGTIDIGTHHISGVMLVKRFSDSSFRFVFNNEIGMKFLDLEFTASKMTVHYCYPEMNKKALLSILGQDFRTLFFPLAGIRKSVLLEYREEGNNRFRIKSGTGSWTYTADSENRIRWLETKGSMVRKTRIITEGSCTGAPASFSIMNPTIRLVIEMACIGG